MLGGLTLSHVPEVLPLLGVLIRLPRRPVWIQLLIAFWLDVSHLDLPEWIQEA
jgi:hypothetical protein